MLELLILEWMYWTPQTAVMFLLVFGMLIVMAALHMRYGPARRKGWMPYPTSRGDRLFLSLMFMCGIGLVWLHFVRIPYGITMWVAFLISLGVGAIIVRKA